MTAPEDQIWAYLQNELAPEDKERFEQTMKNDPSLREALEESQIVHGELKGILPLIGEEESDGLLEDKLLAAWEAGHPKFSEAPRRSHTRILRFTLPLAAAAAAIVLLSVSFNSNPIRWQRTAYGSAPQLRGEPAMQPHYSRANLKQINRELQDTVEAACRPSEKWTLRISLQELAEGALVVEVSGSQRGVSNAWKTEGVKTPPSSKHWNKNFQTLENFRANIPRFGKQIADDIAEQDAP